MITQLLIRPYVQEDVQRKPTLAVTVARGGDSRSPRCARAIKFVLPRGGRFLRLTFSELL